MTRLLLLDATNPTALDEAQSEKVINAFPEVARGLDRWRRQVAAGAQIGIADPRLVAAIRAFLEDSAIEG